MAFGPIGSVWAAGTWAVAWAAGSWGEIAPPFQPQRPIPARVAYTPPQLSASYDSQQIRTQLGALARSVPPTITRTVIADTIVAATDATILVDTTTGPVTVTLLPPNQVQFLPLVIKNIGASYTLLVGTVDGIANPTLGPGDVLLIQSDGIAWRNLGEAGGGGSTLYPILPTEVGVVDDQYPYNDIRRWIPTVAGLSVATITDQTLNAITSRGTYADLCWSWGATYTIDREIQPLEGQTWDFGGATLKRCDQIVDTTTTPIRAGRNNTLTVTNPAQFRVGQTVSVINNTGLTQAQIDASAGTELRHHTISVIDGNDLIVNAPWLNNFPNGGTVVVVFSMITGQDAPNIHIRGGGNFAAVLDGNSPNNTAIQQWILTNTIDLDTDYGSITNLTFKDAQADACIMLGINFVFGGFRIYNCQGNGTHMGAMDNWQAYDIQIYGANLGGPSLGHYSGGFAFSVACGKGQCNDLYVENALSVIGNIGIDVDSEVLFQNIKGRDCEQFLEMVCAATRAGLVTINGFQGFNCGALNLVETQNIDPVNDGPYHIKLAHGELSNTTLNVVRGKHVTIDDVTVDFTGDIVSSPVTLNNCTNVTMTDSCTVIGGLVGVVVSGLCESVKVAASCRDQFLVGALLGVSAGSHAVSYDGGRIRNTAASSPSYVGINLANGTRVTGSEFDIVKGFTAIEFANGGVNITGGIADHNRVRTAAGIHAGVMFGGTLNNYAVYNFYTVAFSSGAPSTDNVIYANMPLDATAAIDLPSVAPVYRYTLYGWQQLTTVPASQVNVPLTDIEGGPLGRFMPRVGVVSKFGYYLSAAPTGGGTAQIIAQISTDQGNTWSNFFDSLGTTQMRLFAAAGQIEEVFTANAPLIYPYAAGNRFRFVITTTSPWAPTANDLRVWMEVTE